MTFRYLFIDIDGVLHSAEAHIGIDDVKAPLQRLQEVGLFTHLDLLASMLEPHQDVRLIVHSSWRQTHGDEELRLLFGPLARQVVGATARELDRQLSIRESIVRLRLGPAQYRVLDDQPELLDGLGEVVIACDSTLGLADDSARRRLVDWLHLQPASRRSIGARL